MTWKAIGALATGIVERLERGRGCDTPASQGGGDPNGVKHRGRCNGGRCKHTLADGQFKRVTDVGVTLDGDSALANAVDENTRSGLAGAHAGGDGALDDRAAVGDDPKHFSFTR